MKKAMLAADDLPRLKFTCFTQEVQINLRSLGVVFPTRKLSAELFAKLFEKCANHRLIKLSFIL